METILQIIIMIIGGGLGALTSVAIIAGMIGTIISKFYKKIRYGASLYD